MAKSNNRGLRYFQRWEFARNGRNWLDLMAFPLLIAVDAARHKIGWKFHTSSHPRALGRPGSGSTDHDPYLNGGEVRGWDLFVDNVNTPEEARDVVQVLLGAGCSAVGVYPHWVDHRGRTRVGFHAGYRPDREDNPARWGMIRDEPRGPQRMVSIDDAISLVGTEPGAPDSSQSAG